MKKWIFTFGVGQELGKNYQPVEAESYEEAREKMREKHGLNWAFQYSEKEFEESRPKYFNDLTALEIIR